MALPALGASIRAVAGLDDDARPFDEALDGVRRAGAEHVMLVAARESPIALLARGAAEMGRRLGRAGLACSLVHLGDVRLHHAAGRMGALDLFCRQAECVAELGCDLLALGADCSHAPGTPLADKWPYIDALISLMEALAARSGMRVCAEIRHGGAVETREDADYFCNEARPPEVGLLLNTGELTTSDEPGWEILDTHLDRVFAVGWQDRPSGESPRSVELGTGATPLVNYWLHLAGREPQPVHVVGLEQAPLADRPDALKRSIAHLRRVWRLET